MPPGQGTQVPCGQRAGEVMAATTATPESVRVGFRTSILRLFSFLPMAVPKMSALLGREDKPKLDEAFFFSGLQHPFIFYKAQENIIYNLSQLRAYSIQTCYLVDLEPSKERISAGPCKGYDVIRLRSHP